MKKPIILILGIVAVLIVILLVNAVPGHTAWRGGVWIGPGPGAWRGDIWLGPGWGPWWWGPPAYPYYDAPRPPVIIQQQPPVYDQQPVEQYYWYYCQESKTYYPYVKECAKGWIKVVPTPTTPKGGE